MAKSLGMEGRDIRDDVVDCDKFSNLHKTVVVENRNSARKKSFVSRFFKEYPNNSAMEVLDPLERGASENLKPDSEKWPRKLWISTINTEADELRHKLFRAICACQHSYSEPDDIEKVWSGTCW